MFRRRVSVPDSWRTLRAFPSARSLRLMDRAFADHRAVPASQISFLPRKWPTTRTADLSMDLEPRRFYREQASAVIAAMGVIRTR